MSKHEGCCGAHTEPHDCECNEEFETFTLIDDDGNEVEAFVLGSFEIEDDSYIALAVINEDERDLDDDVLFFKLDRPAFEIEDEDNIALHPIDDEAEYNKVSETFYNFINSTEIDGME